MACCKPARIMTQDMPLQVDVQAATEPELALWDGWVRSRLRRLALLCERDLRVSPLYTEKHQQTGIVDQTYCISGAWLTKKQHMQYSTVQHDLMVD